MDDSQKKKHLGGETHESILTVATAQGITCYDAMCAHPPGGRKHQASRQFHLSASMCTTEPLTRGSWQ